MHDILSTAFREIPGFGGIGDQSGNFLDFHPRLLDFNHGMPAEPLGFFGNLMLNSGGFFAPEFAGGRGLRREIRRTISHLRPPSGPPS